MLNYHLKWSKAMLDVLVNINSILLDAACALLGRFMQLKRANAIEFFNCLPQNFCHVTVQHERRYQCFELPDVKDGVLRQVPLEVDSRGRAAFVLV